MPRQHKVDAGDDSYICDTDGYAVQAGCYYHIQLPDGRNLAMMPPEDSNFSYMGKLAFGEHQAGYFYLTTDVSSPWQSGYVKLLVRKIHDDPEGHSLYLADDIIWSVPSLASPVYASRSSGRTVFWIPDGNGTLKVGDTPIVDAYDDKYYPLMPNGTERPRDDWWNPLPEDLEVKFVYVEDI
ncbi:hypothetical protein N7540_003742 [Penicillium herquei]|nr:hypothetical protein N7540_003742 [Penicillium herquei]